MSVLIKNMEMPTNCADCPLNYDQMACAVTWTRWWSDSMVIMNFDSDKERMPNCPLIEIPTPHGRLIDVDAHILKIRKQYCEDCSRRKGIKNGKMKFLYEIGGVVCRACEIEDMLNELDDAPTVIEAEGEE